MKNNRYQLLSTLLSLSLISSCGKLNTSKNSSDLSPYSLNCNATRYYDYTNGNDSNNGLLYSPVKNRTTAVNLVMAIPGDLSIRCVSQKFDGQVVSTSVVSTAIEKTDVIPPKKATPINICYVHSFDSRGFDVCDSVALQGKYETDHLFFERCRNLKGNPGAC